MITLDATHTLETSGASGQVIITVDGMEWNTSADIKNYKVLAQGVIQTGAIGSAIYTAPANTTAFVKSIFIVNNSSAEEKITLYIDGHAPANEIFTTLIPINGTAVYNQTGWIVYDSQGDSLWNAEGINNAIGTLTGNTSGTMNPIYGSVSLVGGYKILLSQNANTVTVSHQNQTMDYFDNMDSASNSALMSVALNSVYFFPLANGNLPGYMSVQSLLFNISNNITGTTSSSYNGFTLAIKAGAYSVSNSSINLIRSGSIRLFTTAGSFFVSEMNRYLKGNRWIQFTTGNWFSTAAQGLSLVPANYYLGYQFVIHVQTGAQTSQTTVYGSMTGTATSQTIVASIVPNLTMNLYGQYWWNTMSKIGFVGSASTINSVTKGINPYLGIYSVTSSALPSVVLPSGIF